MDTSTIQRQLPLNYLYDIAAVSSDHVVIAWVVMSKLTNAMIAGDDACCKWRANESSLALARSLPCGPVVGRFLASRD